MAAIFGLGVLVAPATPSGADPAGVTPSFVKDDITLKVVGDETTATANLLVANGGAAGTVTLQFIDDASGKPLPLQKGSDRGTSLNIELPQFATTALSVEVTTGRDAVEGHMVLQAPAAEGATATFHSERSPSTDWLWQGIIASAVLALLIALGGWLAHGSDRSGPWDEFTPEYKWTADGSWASTLTGVTALTGTALGLSGFADDALRGISLSPFIGVDAILLAVLPFAALVFGLFVRKSTAPDNEPAGTVLGFVVASWLTLTAAFAELFVLSLVLRVAHVGHGGGFLAGLLIAAAVLLAFYGGRSIYLIVLTSKKPTGIAAAAPGAPPGKRARARLI
jgi:hypothetical protein